MGGRNMKLQPVRGTRDIYGEEALLFREIESQFSRTAKIFDFQEIQTPIFEFTQVFKRSLGDETDIVNKEMYTFDDRSGDSLTLRPEGTASVVRSVLSESLLRDLPLKLFYSGPMFRHERPQKGRYRQFTQFGVEMIGVGDPVGDIEILSFAWNFFKGCKLDEKVELEINTIGDLESRKNYLEKLTSFLESYKNDLSEDSQRRLKTNPLRILDSKDQKDQNIINEAPTLSDSLNDESKSFFDQVLSGLEKLGLSYKLNPLLVRGLDYYNHSVFEFTTTHLGSQNAVLSGGRYNNLIETMGGPSTPGVGWAAGTDRIALLLEKPKNPHRTLALIAATEKGSEHRFKLLNELREAEIPSQIIYSGNISKQMKKANKRNCSHALIIGDEEIEKETYELKNLKDGSQESFSKEKLFDFLKKQDWGL